MKIGMLVKHHIKQIFLHCETVDHIELDSLLDPIYSKQTFGVNFPFCMELEHIPPDQSRRYWTEVYAVRGKRVRVTSQWFDTSRSLFLHYLTTKGIALELEEPASLTSTVQQLRPLSHRQNGRYRGNHIGNAQNAFIRTILSSLGHESFSEEDWQTTKDYFSHRCAYCGMATALEIDHAIPINKEHLGEHRLGNLVPSCQTCNSNKGSKDYRTFLGGNSAAIMRIESYMDSKNYVPLVDNEQMKLILNMAYKEVAALADRYITIINELFGYSLSSAQEIDRTS